MALTDLTLLVPDLLAEARAAGNGRASRVLEHGDRQRAIAMALTAGVALGEHNSPPAATLQCLAGSVVVRSAHDELALVAGQLAPIPPERHDLAAIEDSVVLLTVAID